MAIFYIPLKYRVEQAGAHLEEECSLDDEAGECGGAAVTKVLDGKGVCEEADRLQQHAGHQGIDEVGGVLAAKLHHYHSLQEWMSPCHCLIGGTTRMRENPTTFFIVPTAKRKN